jgi:hypothetical protein
MTATSTAAVGERVYKAMIGSLGARTLGHVVRGQIYPFWEKRFDASQLHSQARGGVVGSVSPSRLRSSILRP